MRYSMTASNSITSRFIKWRDAALLDLRRSYGCRRRRNGHSAAGFYSVAEDLRLIDKIGGWVLREACRTAATWPENFTIAVNLSPAQFSAGGVSDIVAAALNESASPRTGWSWKSRRPCCSAIPRHHGGAADAQGNGRRHRDG